MTRGDYFSMSYFLRGVEVDIDSRCFSKYTLDPLSDSTPGIALLLAFQSKLTYVE